MVGTRTIQPMHFHTYFVLLLVGPTAGELDISSTLLMPSISIKAEHAKTYIIVGTL